MSISMTAGGVRFGNAANTALKLAAKFWFILAVAGQFIFAFYIASYYGLSAAHGNYMPWNKLMAQGSLGGRAMMGNAALSVHLVFAAIISVSGAAQLVPGIRARVPVVHRWNGRLYIMAAFIMGTTALFMSLYGRKLPGDLPQHLAADFNGVLILVFAALALRTALVRDFRAHRRWALRLFLVVSGVWFFRLGLMLSFMIFKGPFGFDPQTFTGPFLTTLGFAQYAVPLAVLELYFRTQDHGDAMRRFAMAGLLFVLTLATGAGIASATMGMWTPRIKQAFDPRHSIAQTLTETIDARGVDAAAAQYHALHSAPAGTYDFDEPELDDLGYSLIHAHKYKAAIRMFQLNVEAYPKSSNTYDSLGEAYMDDGDKADAIANYTQSLRLNPTSRNGKVMLAKLQAR